MGLVMSESERILTLVREIVERLNAIKVLLKLKTSGFKGFDCAEISHDEDGGHY